MDRTWIAAEACTLPTAEQPVRLAEFDDLLANAVRDVRRVGRTRLRLTLQGDAGLFERVRDLIDRESACCSFFTFTVERLPTDEPALTGLLVDIAVAALRADVLDALAERAAAVGSSARS